jgi:hypothetical protein
MADGQEVDCNSMFSGYPSNVQMSIVVPPNVCLLIGGIVMISGVYLISTNWNKVIDIKNDLMAFANRKAEMTGLPPDLSFLFYFNSRYAGQVEYDLMDRAYQEMMEWKHSQEAAAKA